MVATTKAIYSNCWVVIFMDGNCLRRAWCALEIAVGTSTNSKLMVIGACEIIQGKRFYQELEATFESDIVLIKNEILRIFKSEEEFNEVVAGAMPAMQVLFISAQKSKEYPALHPPREQRAEWAARMPSTNPQMRPRDKSEDWSVLTGNVSHASLRAAPRAVSVFLSSTFSDTVLEWRFFLQDVVPYLKACARSRGLDFDVSDMRFGNTREESLPLEVRVAELERCSKESAGVFYVLVAGDMRGPRPPPARIPREELEGLMLSMSPEETASVRAAYVLDENQLDFAGRPAPEYVLTESESTNTEISGSTNKEITRAQLGEALRRAALKQWPKAAKILTQGCLQRCVHVLFISAWAQD